MTRSVLPEGLFRLDEDILSSRQKRREAEPIFSTKRAPWSRRSAPDADTRAGLCASRPGRVLAHLWVSVSWRCSWRFY